MTNPPTHTYTVTLPDGTTAQRKTHRTYTSCVAVKLDKKLWSTDPVNSWFASTWAGTPALAEKAARSLKSQFSKRAITAEVVVIHIKEAV